MAHSSSLHLHSFWLKKHQISGAYITLAFSPENLEKTIRALPMRGFAGTNITVPHKESALRIVDCLDFVTKQIGAINTIFVNKDGSLSGKNTDGIWFIENLKASALEWNSATSPVVLGAGGASRAVVATLIDVGVP